MNGPHLLLERLLREHTEWLLVYPSGESFALRSHEMRLKVSKGKAVLVILTRVGRKIRMLENVTVTDSGVELELSHVSGRGAIRVSLVPRTPAGDLSTAVSSSRLGIACAIANRVSVEFEGAELKGMTLDRGSGRVARMTFERGKGRIFGVLADVSESLSPEALVTQALSWLMAPGKRSDMPFYRVYLLTRSRPALAVRRLCACLSSPFRNRLFVLTASGIRQKGDGIKGDERFGELPPLEWEELWKGRPPALGPETTYSDSPLIKSLISFAPGEIDRVFTRKGITLRYLGLPFVRVRRIFGEEKVWFGTEKKKQILKNDSLAVFFQLVERIREARRYDSPNKQHLFYRSAPEAWLESLIRRDIRIIGPDLELSPLYHQFRTSRDRIDLLAIRRDGRLVILELKVASDRNMVLQSVDYWRKIEHQRRTGILKKAGIFGKRGISDKPPLVFLVAPSLSFFPGVDGLIRSLRGSIEVDRFELNEDWRKGPKVVRIVTR